MQIGNETEFKKAWSNIQLKNCRNFTTIQRDNYGSRINLGCLLNNSWHICEIVSWLPENSIIFEKSNGKVKFL